MSPVLTLGCHRAARGAPWAGLQSSLPWSARLDTLAGLFRAECILMPCHQQWEISVPNGDWGVAVSDWREEAMLLQLCRVREVTEDLGLAEVPSGRGG